MVPRRALPQVPSPLGCDVERSDKRRRPDSGAAPQRITRRVVTWNPAAILPFRFSMPEGWPSGLRRTLGKRVYGKPYRGFESHSLRQALTTNPFSARRIPRWKRPLLALSNSDLWTLIARRQPKLFSLRPLFSEALYFCPKLRFRKVKQIGRF